MISPVLFYHQDHPLKVDAAPTVVAVLSIEATFIRNSFLCRAALRRPPNTLRKLPHSLDMEASLTANHSATITTDPNGRRPAGKRPHIFRHMELLNQVVILYSYSE